MEEKITWFQQGLRFQCTGCGKCCTGPDGYVFLGEEDITNLAQHHGLTEELFTKRYCRFVDGRYALIDQKNIEGDCIFLKENKCSVYEARPVQCRTFPWWIDNLRSLKDWQEASTHCEGINHPDAPIVSSFEIETQCLTYLDNLLTQNFT